MSTEAAHPTCCDKGREHIEWSPGYARVAELWDGPVLPDSWSLDLSGGYDDSGPVLVTFCPWCGTKLPKSTKPCGACPRPALPGQSLCESHQEDWEASPEFKTGMAYLETGARVPGVDTTLNGLCEAFIQRMRAEGAAAEVVPGGSHGGDTGA